MEWLLTRGSVILHVVNTSGGIVRELCKKAVLFTLSKDHSKVLDALLTSNIQRETSVQDLVTSCVSNSAISCLDLVLGVLKPDGHIVMEALHAACCSKHKVLPTLLQNCTGFDAKFIKQYPNVLSDVYRLQNKEIFDCATVTSYILDGVPADLYQRVVSPEALQSLIKRRIYIKAPDNFSADEAKLFHEDILECLELLVERNPYLVRSEPRTLHDTVKDIEDAKPQYAQCDAYIVDYLKFVKRLLELGFPPKCYISAKEPCTLSLLVKLHFPSEHRSGSNADADFLHLAGAFLSHGCNPNQISVWLSALTDQDFKGSGPLVYFQTSPHWYFKNIPMEAYVRLQMSFYTLLRDHGLLLGWCPGVNHAETLLAISLSRLGTHRDYMGPSIHLCAAYISECDFTNDFNQMIVVTFIQVKLLKRLHSPWIQINHHLVRCC